MIFYRLACYTNTGKALVLGQTELTMHASEAVGRKALNAHKRKLKKTKMEGSARLESLTFDSEFLTKSDWMKLVLGDSPGGMSADEDCMYIVDLISRLDVVAEFEFEPKDEPKKKETK